MMRTNLALLLAMLLWGVWGLAQKFAVTRVHPFTVQWMYAVPYMVAFPLWYWLARQTGVDPFWDGRAFFWALTAGAAALGAVFLLLFAMQTRSAAVVVALVGAYPLVTLLLEVLAGTERIDRRMVLGILFIVAGVILLQKPEV
jgi:drug/metabolite transporter (DMT)-like permease